MQFHGDCAGKNAQILKIVVNSLTSDGCSSDNTGWTSAGGSAARDNAERLTPWDRTAFQGAVADRGSRTHVAELLFESEEFQKQLTEGFYRRFLNRDPEPAGRDFWVDALKRGLREEELLAAFLTSAEFVQGL